MRSVKSRKATAVDSSRESISKQVDKLVALVKSLKRRLDGIECRLAHLEQNSLKDVKGDRWPKTTTTTWGAP